MGVFSAPMLDPLVCIQSRVAGSRYDVRTVELLDASLRALLNYIAKLGGRPDLRRSYLADVDDLLLRRVWLTLPVDPNAREWVDQVRPRAR
jgi:hypothetical protein